MKYLLLLMSFVSLSVSAQEFKGALTYKMEVIPRISQEINLSMKDPSGKKTDSIKVVLNNATFLKKFKEGKQWVDSLRVVYDDNKIKKSYYKKNTLEYVFDFDKKKKYTHTPNYQCVDSVDLKINDIWNKLKITKSDSVYNINGYECKKITISRGGYYYLDLYLSKTDYSNIGDGFLFETTNNLLMSNLVGFEDELQNQLVVQLRWYTKNDQVDIWYKLDQMVKMSDVKNEFKFPEYEYCYWDILDDKKLMRKHKKRMKEMEKNNRKNR